jgi:hypothetical protein
MAKQGRTLWEIFTKSLRSEPPAPQIYNPLKAGRGSLVTIDLTGFYNKTFRVDSITEFKRTIHGSEFVFVDHNLAGGDDNRKIKVRVSSPSGMKATPDHVIVLVQEDEFAYSREFEQVMGDCQQKGKFVVDDDEAKTHEEFFRINEVVEPYEAALTTQPESSMDRKSVRYWDFWRETQDEAGGKKVEYIFVEMDKDSAMFQIWRGEEIPPQALSII